MTSNALDFSSPLSSDEEDYINISLEPIKDAINSELDLFEVVQKFGIKLRKLPKNAKERENWSNHEIYTGDCPKCSEKWSFRVFRETQAFWCLNCHFDGEFPEHGNGGEIFRFLRDRDFLQDHKFLTNCGELIYSGDEGHIAELFELFPEKLAFLKWKNLNRYEYRGDYFNLADKYYPGIEADMERVNTERIKYSKIIYAPKKIWENGRECEQKLYQRFNELEKETSRLYRIIEWYKVVSEIYARREKVDEIIQMQSLVDIWLESWVPDELLEIRKETPEITDNTDYCRSWLWGTATSENIGVHFKIPMDFG